MRQFKWVFCERVPQDFLFHFVSFRGSQQQISLKLTHLPQWCHNTLFCWVLNYFLHALICQKEYSSFNLILLMASKLILEYGLQFLFDLRKIFSRNVQTDKFMIQLRKPSIRVILVISSIQSIFWQLWCSRRSILDLTQIPPSILSIFFQISNFFFQISLIVNPSHILQFLQCNLLTFQIPHTSHIQLNSLASWNSYISQPIVDLHKFDKGFKAIGLELNSGIDEHQRYSSHFVFHEVSYC